MSTIDKLAARHAMALDDPSGCAESVMNAVEWIEASPEHALAFGRANRFMRACGALDDEDRAQVSIDNDTRKAWERLGWLRIAACLGLIVMAAFAFQLAGMGDSARGETYATATGQVRAVRLPDGSQVTLAGASAVTVTYSTEARLVELRAGEALFAVAPDASRPFSVRTPSGSATALGTEFDVRSNDGGATVTVLHGRVAVMASGARLTSRALLDKGMQVRFAENGELGPITTVDPTLVASWRTGEFHFTDTPLGEVVKDLNRYSAKPIVIEASEVAGYPVSGSVESSGIAEWLKSLPAIVDIEVVETSRDLRVRARHGARPATTT